VNARIRNLFGLVVGLFAVLIAFTTYWSVFEADELEANRANKRPLLEEQQIRRGLILARDGAVLATGSIYLIADLVRADPDRRASML